MAQEAAVPKGFWAKVTKLIDDKIAAFARSGFLRNASISDGGLTIRGGFLQLIDKVLGVSLFYVGPVSPNKADGSAQQGMVLRRADGTDVLDLFDANPTDSGGALQQALNWRDRAGNPVFADDTNSGQGLARPYLPLIFYPATFGTALPSTTSSSFVALWRASAYKQQPRLTVSAAAVLDTAGATGEVRIMANGVQLGTTQTITSAAASWTVGPLAVDGGHISALTVEIQGRITSASGTLYANPQTAYGMQS